MSTHQYTVTVKNTRTGEIATVKLSTPSVDEAFARGADCCRKYLCWPACRAVEARVTVAPS